VALPTRAGRAHVAAEAELAEGVDGLIAWALQAERATQAAAARLRSDSKALASGRGAAASGRRSDSDSDAEEAPAVGAEGRSGGGQGAGFAGDLEIAAERLVAAATVRIQGDAGSPEQLSRVRAHLESCLPLKKIIPHSGLLRLHARLLHVHMPVLLGLEVQPHHCSCMHVVLW
jgi:hypothetical protein